MRLQVWQFAMITLIFGIPRVAKCQETIPPNGDKSVGLQLLLGGTFQNTGTHKSDSFHRIIYKGKMLSTNGEQAVNTDPTHTFISSGQSDSNDLIFDLVQGMGTTKNDVLNGLGIDKIPLPKLLGPSFRSALRGGANMDGSAANLSMGYETKLIPIKWAQSGWLIPGINAETRWAKGSKQETVGTASYRLFMGSGSWGRHKRVPFTFQDVVRYAPTVEKLKSFRRTKPNTGIKDLDSFLVYQSRSESFEDPALIYNEIMLKKYDTEAGGFQLSLDNAIWVEGDGWWDAIGKRATRAKTFFAFVWSVYRDLNTAAKTQFQIRYETGFDRTQPDRINRVLGTVGFTL